MKQSIGIFDSGVGGLSIWKELTSLLPYEDTIYIADNKFAPYGKLPIEKIVDRAQKITQYFLDQNVKLVIVACNTATTHAINILRENFDLLFVGVEPAVKVAAENSVSGEVGVLATSNTLISKRYLELKSLYAQKVKVIDLPGIGLVNEIEKGTLKSDQLNQLLHEILLPLQQTNVDQLVLGCTHYPLIKDSIQSILPNHISTVDSGIPVAKQVKKVLEKENLLHPKDKKGSHQFFTTSSPKETNEILSAMSIAQKAILLP